MKRLFISLLITICLPIWLSAQTYTISGGQGTPYIYGDHSGENLTGTGVERVYLLNTLTGATIKYSSSAAIVNFYRYRNSLSDKELIPESDISITSINGNSTYTVSNLSDGYGYLAEENGSTKAVAWIIDYSKYQPVLNSIETIEDEDKCDLLKLFITKTEESLSFYAVSGIKVNIFRKYTISYDKLEWNESSGTFTENTETTSAQEIGTEVIIDAPLINTFFKLRGDQFAEHFNIAKEITSAEYKAVSVESHIVAEQEGASETTESSLGGSAPVTINFYGRANEDVAYFYTWHIYNKEDMDNYIVRYTDKDIRYTFDRTGEFVVQLEVADRTSACIDTTSVSVSTEESELEIPNYFSPGGATHSEFKVKYKSIIKFRGTIFNRWGVKIYQWTDPSKGWDGKYNGRYVSTGVYYCVVEYTGGDGKKRTMNSDINVLRRNN